MSKTETALIIGAIIVAAAIVGMAMYDLYCATH
jgi:hypothetical protein